MLYEFAEGVNSPGLLRTKILLRPTNSLTIKESMNLIIMNTLHLIAQVAPESVGAPAIDPNLPAAPTVEQMGFFENVLHQYTLGGVFMHPIALVGLIALYIVFERYQTLYVKTRFNKDQILGEVRNAVFSGRLQVMGDTLVHKITQAGFQAFERSDTDAEVQIAIDSAAAKYFPMLEKKTAYLSMLANIATLLGLLGTISGLIIAFGGAAAEDVSKRAEILSRGISEAMNCTAFGLIVAIPSLLAFALLQGRTQRIIDDVNEVVLDAMNFVVSNRDKLKKKSA
jgi:biopolymer transport protein ExbB